MTNTLKKSETPSKKQILSDIEKSRSTVPKIIDRIMRYNKVHTQEQLEIDALGKNHAFLVRCANDLNELYETEKKEAERLTAGLRSALTRSAKIILNVRCDVSRITDGTEAD